MSAYTSVCAQKCLIDQAKLEDLLPVSEMNLVLTTYYDFS